MQNIPDMAEQIRTEKQLMADAAVLAGAVMIRANHKEAESAEQSKHEQAGRYRADNPGAFFHMLLLSASCKDRFSYVC